MSLISCNQLKILKSNLNKIHGINPVMTCEATGKTFDLPRFCSIEMQQARSMNVIAKRDLYREFSNRIPPNATEKDIGLLTSMSEEASHNRAVWINPKDRQPYYLIKEDETDKDFVLRILNKDGCFVKNAKVEPQNVYLCDLREGEKHITQIMGIDFNHSDLMGLIADRYNPFAKYNLVSLNNDEELLELIKSKPKNTACIEFSYGVFKKCNFEKGGKQTAKEYSDEVREALPECYDYLSDLKSSIKSTRVLASSGNDGDMLNCFLLDTGVEGVGGLDVIGRTVQSSGSRNSYFTQHYEPFYFPITTTNSGINISGLRGTDIEILHDIESNKYIGKVCGTSFSAPVRAAKISLNKMLEGVL